MFCCVLLLALKKRLVSHSAFPKNLQAHINENSSVEVVETANVGLYNVMQFL